MGQPAAKQGDTVSTMDTHIVLVPSPGGPVPTPIPHAFSGVLNSGLSTTVFVGGLPAATLNSVVINQPPHLPMPPGISFQIPPTNQGVVMSASGTVFIDGLPAARNGDTVQTCADPVPNTAGTLIASGTVFIGG